MALAATLVGCQGGPSASTPAAIPTGDGVVAGGINYCVGTVPPTGAKNPGLVAGTVTVLHGKVSDVPKAGGVKYVLPTHRVASETVAKHMHYRFVLAPGPYLLVDPYKGRSNFGLGVSVVVRRSAVTKQNMPNLRSWPSEHEFPSLKGIASP
jgi:hypothetical protein